MTFDNVIVEGEPVLGWEDKHLKTNNTETLKLVYDFKFNYTDGVDEITIGPELVGDDADDIYYTIDGRMVKNPTRGIYIKNGKKYVKF